MTEQIDWTSSDRQQSRERRANIASRVLKIDAVAVMTIVAAALVAAICLLRDAFGIDTVAAGITIATYTAIAMLALSHLRKHPYARFGGANVITTFRAAMTAMIAGIVLASDRFGEPGNEAIAWSVAGLAGLALALDGVDGYIARRSGNMSKFGARFDMEVDALLILILSIAAFVLDKAGLWVVLIGLMRYLFVAAQAFTPALRKELDESFRRKTICVVQGAALCLLLVPVVTPPVSMAIASVALLLLVWSFAVDVYALLSSRSEQRQRS
jgi:phosphatidylglycerophosphate synthase